MKKFNKFISENYEEYPADEMTITELKVAIDAATNILKMLEKGSKLQRWQISAIVKSSEELSSVYSIMNADMNESSEAEANYIVKMKSPFWKTHHYVNLDDPRAQVSKKHPKHATPMSLEKAQKVAKDWKGGPNKYETEVIMKEEADFKVSIEGLPQIFVKGENPSDVKNNLRKVLKNPGLINDVKRVTKPEVLKTFRDFISNKEDETEGDNE